MIRTIAFITMAIDHIGSVFFPQFIIFRIIGRLAFPLFAFGIAKGYSYTRDVSKYGQRILFLALVSQPIFYLTLSQEYLNICFTLTLGLLAIYLYDKTKNLLLKVSLPIIVAVIAQIIGAEYGAYGVLMILFFHIFKDKPYLLITQSLLIFAYILIDLNQIISLFAIPAFFLAYYIKKPNFRLNRYVQYLFYPAHLFIIYIIHKLIAVLS